MRSLAGKQVWVGNSLEMELIEEAGGKWGLVETG